MASPAVEDLRKSAIDWKFCYRHLRLHSSRSCQSHPKMESVMVVQAVAGRGERVGELSAAIPYSITWQSLICLRRAPRIRVDHTV